MIINERLELMDDNNDRLAFDVDEGTLDVIIRGHLVMLNKKQAIKVIDFITENLEGIDDET